MWLRSALLCVLLGAGAAWASRDTVVDPQGILVAEPPFQEVLRDAPISLERAGFNLMPVARFDIKARILRQRVYESDTVAALSPVDLALGWGPMSDSRVLAHIQMSQGQRFFYWRTEASPVPRQVIESYSTNVHTIPATPEIERRLKSLHEGDVVRFSGLLVNAHRAADGYRWKTSMVRDDTGDGACEIVWVTDLQIVSHAPSTSVALTKH